ncbi:MAG: TlpA family protein disulfide reductase [Gemmatimonadetes bacterium]|nr:TlpA family protein disulfide reductase [Gemmatimonadota bacterium]
MSVRGLARRVVLAFALGGCARGDRAEATSAAPVAVGAPAPTYAATSVAGAPVALADLRGRVVLLNIWATWCKPCRQEMPALDTLQRRHEAAGLTVVGVSIDEPGERDRIAPFAQELGASYALWHDPDDRVSSTFLAIGVPASYLIDRDGTLRWRHVGPVTADDPALTAALREALGTTGGATSDTAAIGAARAPAPAGGGTTP